jgi:pimeloyl-ACP methyl ester carboxylesterase
VRFLQYFVDHKALDSRRGKIFTTNYDLLLFWVVSRSGRKQLKCHDGFISPPENREFGAWNPDKVASLVYLHGALHIHKRNGQHRMLRYREGARLVDQIRDRLALREFPMIVAEGTSQRKAMKIGTSDYLEAAARNFRSTLNDNSSALFIFGHSLGERDAHILRQVGERRVRAVYVGAFGGLDTSDGERARQWANVWWQRRAQAGDRWPLEVAVFDSRQCPVWRPT